VCASLSEEDIRGEIREGNLTLENLHQWFGNNRNCGICVLSVIEMIKKEEKQI
jgi:bacterioferritin-associated ferredoxin